MKKAPEKLRLHRETLRALEQVAGGAGKAETRCIPDSSCPGAPLAPQPILV